MTTDKKNVNATPAAKPAPAQAATAKPAPAQAATSTDKTAPARRGRKPVDPNETPSERFKRLATARTSGVLDGIRLLCNLCNGDYEFTAAQWSAIRGAINSSLAELDHEIQSALAENKQTETKSRFSLD